MPLGDRIWSLPLLGAAGWPCLATTARVQKERYALLPGGRPRRGDARRVREGYLLRPARFPTQDYSVSMLRYRIEASLECIFVEFEGMRESM